MIKIGAVVATRGPTALLGQSFLKAIQLAKEELKNTRHQYELVIEEITSPDKAEPAIQKLIKRDQVDGLIVGLSMSGQIAKTYATAAKIPLFCICSVSSVGDELYTFTIMRWRRTKRCAGSAKPSGAVSGKSPDSPRTIRALTTT